MQDIYTTVDLEIKHEQANFWGDVAVNQLIRQKLG